MNENKYIQRFTCALEKFLHKHPSLFRLYSLPYSRVLRREISLAGISSKDTVLNVGCGSLPFTAVYIAESTGAKVYAVDNDPKAVKYATDLVDKLGLSGSIKVLEADGKETVPIEFDIAVLALHVEPKSEVLKNLLPKKVMMRIPRKSLETSYGLDSIPYTPLGQVDHMMPTFDRSLLYG